MQLIRNMLQLIICKAVIGFIIYHISSCNGQTPTTNDPKIIFVDEPERTTCILPTGLNGFCVPITECPSASRLITNGDRPEICRFERSTPIICCSKNTDFPFDVAACAPTKIDDDLPTEFLRTKTGNGAKVGAWPWTVAIYLKSDESRSNSICGGSLITTNVILTAAQCFFKSPVIPTADDLVVVLGIDTIAANTTQNISREVCVEKLIPHENYKFPIMYNDIAVLKLKEEVEFTPEIRPICLPAKDLHKESFEVILAIITGTGGIATENTNTQAAPLVIPNQGCEDVLKKNTELMKKLPQGVTSKLICAGGPPQENVVCSGAIGSSLATQDSSLSHFIIIGVQTFEADCRKGIPGLSTRITEYSDWIVERLINLTT